MTGLIQWHLPRIFVLLPRGGGGRWALPGCHDRALRAPGGLPARPRWRRASTAQLHPCWRAAWMTAASAATTVLGRRSPTVSQPQVRSGMPVCAFLRHERHPVCPASRQPCINNPSALLVRPACCGADPAGPTGALTRARTHPAVTPCGHAGIAPVSPEELFNDAFTDVRTWSPLLAAYFPLGCVLAVLRMVRACW